ncbi:MAG: 2'-deoxycytidine 5'-triphosphate deaminase, partial [Pseudomonadota bacterium]
AESGIIGWRARRHSALIDLSRLAAYDPAEFWEPVRPAAHGGVILDPGAFYILVSREAVAVPPGFAAEMVPYMAVAGEFRVHYAGFFDPGFGHPSAGGTGSRGVLEVRCHEAPFALEHGQTVGRLVYERMAAEPDLLYGRDIGSNYQGQALKLSKHFRAG